MSKKKLRSYGRDNNASEITPKILCQESADHNVKEVNKEQNLFQKEATKYRENEILDYHPVDISANTIAAKRRRKILLHRVKKK